MSAFKRENLRLFGIKRSGTPHRYTKKVAVNIAFVFAKIAPEHVCERYAGEKQPFVGAKCLQKSRCGIANEGIGESAREGATAEAAALHTYSPLSTASRPLVISSMFTAL